MCFQRLGRRAACVASVGQHSFRQPDCAVHAQDGFGKARRIGRGGNQVGRQDKLRAIGADDGLRVVSLTVFMRVGPAHQRAVRVGEVALPLGRRRDVGWEGRSPTPTFLGVIGGLLGLIGRAGSLGFGARFGFHPGASRIELGLECFAPGQFPRQRLGIVVLGVGRLGPRGQVRDVGRELGAQLLRPVVAHGTDLGGVGVDLGTVDGHRANPQQPRLASYQKDVEERRLEGRTVLPPERRDGVMIGVGVGGYEAHAQIAEGGPLDPPRGEHAVGVGIHQQSQHHARMVLRLA